MQRIVSASQRRYTIAVAISIIMLYMLIYGDRYGALLPAS